GAPSLRMQVAMSAVLAASGVLVLILIIALSNPFRGDFRVSTAPFELSRSRRGMAAWNYCCPPVASIPYNAANGSL
ncbi:MAG TPA: hypothetical protein VNY06_07725, partial [Methylocella sp.]|nr:hypothetical protein [Methylocella sp.]